MSRVLPLGEIKFSFVNVCETKSKIIFPDFIEFITNYDVIGITISETKLCNHDIFEVDDYTVFRKDRRQPVLRSSDGLACHVSNMLVLLNHSVNMCYGSK